MNTKANIGAPPSSRRRETMADLTARPLKPANNMSGDVLKDLSFKVEADFHNRFKTASSHYGKSMKRVLQEAFELWLIEQTSKDK